MYPAAGGVAEEKKPGQQGRERTGNSSTGEISPRETEAAAEVYSHGTTPPFSFGLGAASLQGQVALVTGPGTCIPLVLRPHTSSEAETKLDPLFGPPSPAAC